MDGPEDEYGDDAVYFAWVDAIRTTIQNPRYHDTCWCKGKDAIKNGEKRVAPGTTTGKINCEGMHLL